MQLAIFFYRSDADGVWKWKMGWVIVDAVDGSKFVNVTLLAERQTEQNW